MLALALGLIRLGSAPLTYDEHVTIRSAQYPLGGIWNLARHTEAPHAAYYVLIKPWLTAFGTSSWVARFPSVEFGALAAAATTLLGTCLFDRLAGLAAGLLLATSTYFVGALGRCRRRRGLGEPLRRLPRRLPGRAPVPAPKTPLLTAGVVVVATAPLVVLVLARENPLLLVAAALGMVGLTRGAAAGAQAWKTTLLCAWLAAPFVVTLVLSAVQPAFLARYLVSAAPALALLAGAGVVSLRRWPGLLAAGALLVFVGIRLAHHYY